MSSKQKQNEIRDPTRDGEIKELIERNWSPGLFWADGAAEEKNPNYHKLYIGGFLIFCGQKILRPHWKVT